MARGASGGPGKETAAEEEDIDALFRLPLSEFTAARNALAASLKKAGYAGESQRVKALAKPTLSAWAVNQLYWRHLEEFRSLIAAGERAGKAHSIPRGAKGPDVRELLAARRDALTALLGLAAGILREAGNNAAPETLHRITTTLEALSASAALPDGISPGRLSGDVDPPGLDSLALWIPASKEPHRPAAAAAPAAPPQPIPQHPAISKRDLTKYKSAVEHAEKDAVAARRRLEQAIDAEKEAREELAALRVSVEAAHKAVREAEQNVETARRDLAGAEG